MSAARKLSGGQMWVAFCAGKAIAHRRRWMNDARNLKAEGIHLHVVRQAVSYARASNRELIAYLRQVRS